MMLTQTNYDDLSNLMRVDYSDRVVVYFDCNYSLNLRQHPQDKNEKRVPFVTYVGGETKAELKAIAQCYDFKSYQIRSKKRTTFPFEMKLKGIKFTEMKTLIGELNND